MGQPKTDETQFGMQWQKRKEKEKCGRWVRHTHTHIDFMHHHQCLVWDSHAVT
jgi:hypothetical protein